MVNEDLGSVCINCGSLLNGEYCSKCGQKASKGMKPFTELLADGLDVLSEINTRFLRTIALLILKPGVVNLAYLSGKRQEFTSPVRLCLTLLAMFVAGMFAYAEWTETYAIKVEVPIWAQSVGLAIGLLTPVAMALCLKIIYPSDLFHKHFVFCLYYVAAGIVLGGPFWIIHTDYPLIASIGGGVLFMYLLLAVWQVYGGAWWVFGLKFSVISAVFMYGISYGTSWLGTNIILGISQFIDTAQLPL